MTPLEQNDRRTGMHYEDVACEYLEQNGLEILERNFRIRSGEIDIIAKEQDTVCFVEVKYRRTNLYGRPAESVTAAKQKTIRKVAEYWIVRHGYHNRNARFDVVEITGHKINYIKYAF